MEKDAFCMTMNGKGRVMLMGFQRAFGDDAMCINFLFEGWAIDSAGKYAGAVIATFLMAFTNEALSHARRLNRRFCGRNPTFFRAAVPDAFLYGIQMVIAYFLMLLAMTYESIVFSAIVVGLVLGHLFWGNVAPRLCKHNSPDEFSKAGLLNTDDSISGNTPCCGGNDM